MPDLKERLQSAGVSPVRVGQIFEVTLSQAHRWIEGEEPMKGTLDQFVTLAHECKCDIWDFYGSIEKTYEKLYAQPIEPPPDRPEDGVQSAPFW